MMGLYDKIFAKTAKHNNYVKVKYSNNLLGFHTPYLYGNFGNLFIDYDEMDNLGQFYDYSTNTLDLEKFSTYLQYLKHFVESRVILKIPLSTKYKAESENYYRDKYYTLLDEYDELSDTLILTREDNINLRHKLSENDYLGEIWNYIEQRTEHLEESDIIQNIQNEDDLLGRISELEIENEKLKQELNKLYCSEKYGVKRKNIPQNTRLEIFYRDKGVCSHCGEKLDVDGKWHIDHIFPVSKGGDNRKNNLQLLCPHCNTSKNNRTDILKDKQRLEELSDEYFEYSVNIRDIMEDSDE